MMDTFEDPVCGMQVTQQSSADWSDYDGRRYYFCSLGCKHAFDRDPEEFLSRAAETQSHAGC
jgi:YHS domain-containing protein